MEMLITSMEAYRKREVCSNNGFTSIKIQDNRSIYMLYRNGSIHYLNQVMMDIFTFCNEPQKVVDVISYILEKQNMPRSDDTLWHILLLLTRGEKVNIWRYQYAKDID